jgi:hypothetical protein
MMVIRRGRSPRQRTQFPRASNFRELTDVVLTAGIFGFVLEVFRGN